MSLITRCPACETMFKVVPDQLRISDGWVRCGQCGEIFDASQHLLTDPLEEVTAPRDSRPVPLPVEAMPSAAPVPAAPVQPAPMPEPPVPEQPAPPPVARHDPEPVGDSVPSVPPSEPLWVETVAPQQDTPEPVPAPEPVLAPEPPPAVPREERLVIPEPSVPVRDETEDAPEPSFMRDGTRKTLWQRPVVRIVLLLLVLLLLAAFAAQALLHERDRVAATQPSARPALLALCALAGCSLSPLQQIESVAIESSSFTLLRADSYKLAFSLKNNAVLDLAMPAIELSLTDTQDQPLIRRVIPPAEFSPTSSRTLAAGADWNGSLSLSVKADPGLGRIAGYRLLAFYP